VTFVTFSGLLLWVLFWVLLERVLTSVGVRHTPLVQVEPLGQQDTPAQHVVPQPDKDERLVVVTLMGWMAL